MGQVTRTCRRGNHSYRTGRPRRRGSLQRAPMPKSHSPRPRLLGIVVAARAPRKSAEPKYRNFLQSDHACRRRPSQLFGFSHSLLGWHVRCVSTRKRFNRPDVPSPMRGPGFASAACQASGACSRGSAPPPPHPAARSSERFGRAGWPSETRPSPSRLNRGERRAVRATRWSCCVESRSWLRVRPRRSAAHQHPCGRRETN
jgi:hypothetical protein